MWSLLYSHIVAQLSLRVTNQSNDVVLVVLRVKKGNWKLYQQDREGLELIQRLKDPVTAHPEYWGECSLQLCQNLCKRKKRTKGDELII